MLFLVGVAGVAATSLAAAPSTMQVVVAAANGSPSGTPGDTRGGA